MFPDWQTDAGGPLALQEKRLLHPQKDQRLHTRRKSAPASNNNMLWHHRRAAMFFEEQKLKKQLDLLEFEERESKIKLRNMERELRSDLRRMRMELRSRGLSGATNQGLRLPTGIVVTDEHGDDCEVEFLSLTRTTYSRETQVSPVASCLDSMRPGSVKQQSNSLPHYVLPSSPSALSTEVPHDNLSESGCKSSKRGRAKTMTNLKTTSGESRVRRRPRSASMSNVDPSLLVPSPNPAQVLSRERATSTDSLDTGSSQSTPVHFQTDLSDQEDSVKTKYTPLVTEVYANEILRIQSRQCVSEKPCDSSDSEFSEGRLKTDLPNNLSDGVKCRVKIWLQKSREKERDLVKSRTETPQRVTQGQLSLSPVPQKMYDSEGQKNRLPNVFERLSQGHLKTRRPPLPRRIVKCDLERSVASAWEQARKCRYIRNYVPPDRRGRFST
ncbi:uncharacterized protein LOC144905626 [Branchiostoma floridae x Branchiostoma belcheri]